VGPRAVLDAVVKRKIPIPRRESNPTTPIIQLVAQLLSKKFLLLFFVISDLFESIGFWFIEQFCFWSNVALKQRLVLIG
jgi:hypothetical protein